MVLDMRAGHWSDHVSRKLRAPTTNELAKLSDLCFRSKAMWGYDTAFMEACRRELTFAPCDLHSTQIAVVEEDGNLVGVAQIKVLGDQADLLKLFVDPSALHTGIGAALLAWAAEVAQEMGAKQLVIEADPGAAPFYRRMGARDVGHAASGSIPGRVLPKLMIDVKVAG